jgi:Tol biopolymer transport system component
LGASVEPAVAATFTVNTTKDHAPHAGACASPPVAGDCALRQAVAMANAHPSSTIALHPGTYRLTIAPSGADDNSTGDLNVTAATTISGSNPTTTIIEAGVSAGNGIDGVLAVHGSAPLNISGVTIRFGNSTGTGGGIFDESTGLLTISHSIITGNQAGDGGGIAEEDGGKVTIIGSTISHNTALSLGGGIAQEGPGTGSINISRSTIEDNTSIAQGGGIAEEEGAPVTITASTIDGNTADWGGGIAEECCFSSTAPADTLINDTITNNHAIGPAGGNVGAGGLNLDGDGTVVIKNSTISANTSTVASGANIYDDGTDPVDLTNTIISGGHPANCAGGDIFSTGTHGPGSANGHNLLSDSTCGASASGNPKLGPLAYYGGPTYTEALTAGSPAIDHGTSIGCPAKDQRGVTRPQGAHCDIGAYEMREVPIPTISSLSPNVGVPGKSETVEIHGSNFQPGAKASFGPGIAVKKTTFINADHLTAEIAIAFSAQGGTRTVSVVNPDLGAGACNLCFLVSEPALPGKIALQSNRTGKYQIYAISAGGTSITRLTHDSGNDVGAAWSPNGAKIAFVSDRSGHQELYVMKANGTGVIRITNVPGQTNWGQPTWSPDGSMLADENNQTGHFEIYTMHANGTNLTQITPTGTIDYGAPSWSPDGTKLVLDSNLSGEVEIYTMPPSGGALTQLTSNPGYRNGDPEWSPDGMQIVFDSTRDGNPEIYSMDANGSNQTRLTNNPAADVDPTWSGDGNWIAFQSNRSGNAEIFTMTADGSRQVERTYTSGAVNDGATWTG